MGRQHDTGSSEVAQLGAAATPRDAQPRVALVGPVLPYRGGIAQHTTLLHRALRGRAELLTLSFSRQYPHWLFPGASDIDADHGGHREPNVEYAIDSLDPRTWRRAVSALRTFAPSGVVIPWWSVYWTFCFRYIAGAMRADGVPLAFLCHNVVEHEQAAWRRWLRDRVLGRTDRFVVHDEVARRQLLERFPRAKVGVHPHPTHSEFPDPESTPPRRAALELLFFGFVRPYKGLDDLVEAMGRLRGRDIMLTVAGEFWSSPDACRARIAELGIGKMVEILPRYVSAPEVARLFARADVVVLPYRSATASAVIPIALRYGKVVIATAVGGLPEAVIPGETGVLVPARSPEALAGAIEGMSAERAAAMVPCVQALAASLTWDGLARTVLDTLDLAR